MPIKRCQSNKKKGYRWGSKGKCYIKGNARKKARKQGIAITLSKKRRKNYLGGIKTKRKRPRAHYRTIKTKCGKKRILVNKDVKRRI